MTSVDKVFIYVSIGIAIVAIGLVAGFNSTQTTETVKIPETTIEQQAIDPRLMKEPFKVKPGTMPLIESLSAKQLEQAKVREFSTIPQRVPSTPSSTGEGILALAGEGMLGLKGVLCVDCVTAAHIAADAVGASEIAANAVGASEIAANAVGASEIAANAVGASEIAANAVGASELKMSISSYAVTNNGGSKYVEKFMVPVNEKNFCFLVKVKMENVDTGGEYAECDIDYGGKSKWLLQAILGEKNNDANVSCQAVCISYG